MKSLGHCHFKNNWNARQIKVVVAQELLWVKCTIDILLFSYKESIQDDADFLLTGRCTRSQTHGSTKSFNIFIMHQKMLLHFMHDHCSTFTPFPKLPPRFAIWPPFECHQKHCEVQHNTRFAAVTPLKVLNKAYDLLAGGCTTF